MTTSHLHKIVEPETGVAKRGPTAVQPERELDAAVAEVHKLKGDAAVTGWALGSAIFEIATRGLWRLRQDIADTGARTPRWSSFDAFCKSELSMTPTNARTLMDVSRAFTEAEVRAWGSHKLGLLRQAPPEDRPQLRKLLESGGTYRQVREEVGKVKRAKGYTKPSRAGDARGGKTGRRGKRPKQIRISQILGAITVELFAKPDSMKDVDWKALDRATKLAQQPVGRLELAEQLTMLFGITASPGGDLQLKVTIERSEA